MSASIASTARTSASATHRSSRRRSRRSSGSSVGATSPTSHPGPLAGLRVLELAQIMAGPTCGMMLADMGADVIKVEKLPGGDDARGYREPRINGVSAPFLILNRNKRGVALDLKHPRGRDILLRGAETADGLGDNLRRAQQPALLGSTEYRAAA